jgi:hypothetical protein
VPEFTGQTAVATLELVVDEQPTADPATDLYRLFSPIRGCREALM